MDPRTGARIGRPVRKGTRLIAHRPRCARSEAVLSTSSSSASSSNAEATPRVDPATSRTSPGRPRRGLGMYVVAAIALVVLLVAVFVVPTLTGSGSGGSTTVLTFSGARPIADQKVAAFESGGWNLLFAAGIVSATPFPEMLNTTAFGNFSCTLTPILGGGSLTLPGYSGDRSSGAARAWEFGYANSVGTLAVVSVIDGHGAVLATLTGLECALVAQLVTPLSGSVIDSSAAAAAARPAAQAFLAAHPNATAEFALIGSASFLGAHPSPEWSVRYSTCSLSASAAGNGAQFNATVNATNGHLMGSNLTLGVPCGTGTPPHQLPTSLILSAAAITSVGGFTNYTFTVQVAGSGVTWDNLTAEVASGTAFGASPPIEAGWAVEALTSSGTLIASYNPPAVSWSAGGSTSIALGDQLRLSTATNLAADSLFLEGEGSFGGGETLTL